MELPSDRVVLTGQLICADTQEAAIVREYLEQHTRLTRAEPGCLLFSVEQSHDPLIWNVHEMFADQASFETHQTRASRSVWGHATTGIVREYTITHSNSE